jgi:hypothetical protein
MHQTLRAIGREDGDEQQDGALGIGCGPHWAHGASLVRGVNRIGERHRFVAAKPGEAMPGCHRIPNYKKPRLREHRRQGIGFEYFPAEISSLGD